MIRFTSSLLLNIVFAAMFLCSFSTPLFAQDTYWIFFSDKGDISQYSPADLLSPRALQSRARQGIAIDFRDYPVNAAYTARLAQEGIAVRHVSRWFNAASAVLTPAQVQRAQSLACVHHVASMRAYRTVLTETEAAPQKTQDDYDTPNRQLSILKLDSLHAMGFTGQGVLMAVMDNGFNNVDSLDVLAHVRLRSGIITTKDYVDGDTDVYSPCPIGSACRHGVHCFSMIAAGIPGTLVGSAPDAEYILLRTENDSSETYKEEDNWVAAAEYADSLGAQVFSTSLGYLEMDGGTGYTNADMDGNTAIITKAADIAASKGIVVVNSAGNNGSGGISAPADADSILAVGSTDQYRQYSGFSSVGPSADSRVKPDVTTMGQSNFYASPDNSINRGSGTSYSCPIIAGLAACLVQAAPTATNMQIRSAIIQSADKYTTPDIYYGYGIPDALKAKSILTLLSLDQQQIRIIGNPNEGEFFIGLSYMPTPGPVTVEVFDFAGRLHFSEKQQVNTPLFRVKTSLQSGLYILRVTDAQGAQHSASMSVMVR